MKFDHYRTNPILETCELSLFRLNEISEKDHGNKNLIWNNPEVAEILKALADVKLLLKEGIEKEVKQRLWEEKLSNHEIQSDKDIKEDEKAAAIEAFWKEKQGVEYGSY